MNPNPAAISRSCEKWQLSASEVALVGDFRFDIEAGRAGAGVRTVLYTVEGEPSVAAPGGRSRLLLSLVSRAGALFRWLAEPLYGRPPVAVRIRAR